MVIARPRFGKGSLGSIYPHWPRRSPGVLLPHKQFFDSNSDSTRQDGPLHHRRLL